LIQESQVLGSFIHPDTWILIQDPEKQPTPAETAALSAPRLLHDAAALAEQEWNKVQSDNPDIFTDISPCTPIRNTPPFGTPKISEFLDRYFYKIINY
jgi:hypothetical protein